MDPRKSGGGSANEPLSFFDSQNYVADLSHLFRNVRGRNELRVYRLAKRALRRLRVPAAEGQI